MCLPDHSGLVDSVDERWSSLIDSRRGSKEWGTGKYNKGLPPCCPGLQWWQGVHGLTQTHSEAAKIRHPVLSYIAAVVRGTCLHNSFEYFTDCSTYW